MGFPRVVRKLMFGYVQPVKQTAAALVLSAIAVGGPLAQAQEVGASQPAPFVAHRSRLPEALQHVPLNRLSSGALMLLDRGGDLVRPPAATQFQTARPQE